MKSIPRFLVGSAVVLAALLTAAPLTAGVADHVLNPGQSPLRRAAAEAAGTPGHAVSPDARIAELAADLQAGVEAGEMTPEDAKRVLGDMSAYIRGERTFPERRTI